MAKTWLPAAARDSGAGGEGVASAAVQFQRYRGLVLTQLLTHQKKVKQHGQNQRRRGTNTYTPPHRPSEPSTEGNRLSALPKSGFKQHLVLVASYEYLNGSI